MQFRRSAIGPDSGLGNWSPVDFPVVFFPELRDEKKWWPMPVKPDMLLRRTLFWPTAFLISAPGLPALLMLMLASALLGAQDHNPFAGDPKAAKAGEFEFRINCAFCHGLGARGGGRGPDLTRAQKHHGSTDGELFHNIHDGIAGTAMPAATNGGIGVGMSDEEIWQVITYIRSVEKKASAAETGDVAHGKELFYGAAGCGTCHMVNGKGGRLGPDLSSTGASRSVEYLTESLRNPSKRLAQGISEPLKDFSQEYETVTVVTSDGTKLQGVVLNEDSFTVQMLDTREQWHAFEKVKLR